MSEVILKPEEFIALEDFNDCREGESFEYLVNLYLTNYRSWNNTYLPLKNMGLEKFVRCLLDGYKMEEPEFKSGKLNVSLNLPMENLLRNPDVIDPIFVRFSENMHKGLSINEAEFLIDSLQKTVTFLKENNIGGR